MAHTKRNIQGRRPAPPPPAARSTPSAPRLPLTPAVGFCALLAMTLACYLPVMLWGGFVWDDVDHIPGETALRDWAGLQRFWFAPNEVREPHYRPLTYTTFWLEHKLWGFAPQGYHVVNVLLHAANAALLWRILHTLAVPGAWMIAAVFAVHPLHVESVAWTIERKDVLSGVFYLGCVWTWLRFLPDAPERRALPPAVGGPPVAGSAGGTAAAGAAGGKETPWLRYAAALALLTAGMLAKNMVVTLPAALLVLHWWRSGRFTWLDVARLAPLFAVALALVAVDLRMVTSKTPASFDYSAGERLLIAARAIWFYVGKLAWPGDLPVIYSHWDVRLGNPWAWTFLAAALALAAALWFWRHRFGRGPLAGALFFVVTLSPTLGFVDHTYMLFSFVADRYQYLAGIGALAVAIGIAAVLTRQLPSAWRWPVLGTAAAALLLLGSLTWRQAAIYRDETTFFSHIVERNPDAVGAHLNLAKALIAEGRLAEALDAARIAVAQRPRSHDALVNLAVALGELERFDEAERHLRRAVEIAPKEEAGKPLENLGVLLSRRNQIAEAEAVLRQALDLAPDDLSILRNLAKLHRAREQPDDALRLYDRLAALGAGDLATHTARGELLAQLERHDEALAAWRQALGQAREPSAAFALHLAMGRTEWAKSGAADAAAPHYERALAIHPRHAGTLGDLASLRVADERYDEALALFARAIAETPDAARLHAGRGYALYRLGQFHAAIESLERALALDPALDEARGHLALARRDAR